jgi:hypothetical protein
MTDSATITDQMKAACAKREVGMRRRLYPRWVAEGRNGWTEDRADKEIATMQAIADDYDRKVSEEAARVAPKLI